MHLMHRWLIVFMLAATVVMLPPSPAVPVQAAPVPVGLAAEDWQQIQALLPSEPTILHASDAEAYQQFGSSVATDGVTVVVGSRYSGGIYNSGKVYVFEKHYVDGATLWAEQAILEGSSVTHGDNFGSSVALDGDTLVIGAPGKSHSPDLLRGVAYVFERDPQTHMWHEQAILYPSTPHARYPFADAVAISGDTIAIGASSGYHSAMPSSAGLTYIFEQDLQTGVWHESALLHASNAGSWDIFGAALALEGDMLIVGAPQEDGATDTLMNVGAVYVFTRDRQTGAWTEQSILRPRLLQANSRFGEVLDFDQSTLAVGAPNIDGSDGKIDIGAVVMFEWLTTGWVEQTMLYASNAEAQDYFGFELALFDQVLVASSPWKEDLERVDTTTGAAYMFMKQDSSWVEEYILHPYKPQQYEGFGSALALADDTLIVYASGDDGVSDTITNTGAVYVYDLQPNQAHTAVAGGDQTVKVFETVTLSATASYDPDHDALSYEWRQRSGPAVTLTTPFSATTDFIASSLPSVLAFDLIVTDAFGATSSDDVLISVTGQQIWLPQLHKVCGLTQGCR